VCPFGIDYRAPLPDGVLLTSIYSRQDGVVRWQSCVAEDATCIEVTGSHVGLIYNRSVYRAIGAALCGADNDVTQSWGAASQRQASSVLVASAAMTSHAIHAPRRRYLELSRLGAPEYILCIAGPVLLAAMFLPWFQTAGSGGITGHSGAVSAWVAYPASINGYLVWLGIGSFILPWIVAAGTR
jgi:hypothetical protein